MANAFLDILSANPNYKEQLRNEVENVLQTEQDWADNSMERKLVHIDSTIKEGLRMNPILTRVAMSEVMPKEGLMTPSGYHLTQGTWITAPTYGVQHDEDNYEKSDEYNPFRFVDGQGAKARKPVEGETVMTPGGDEALKSHNTNGLTTITDSFLAWGYGKFGWSVAQVSHKTFPSCFQC